MEVKKPLTKGKVGTYPQAPQSAGNQLTHEQGAKLTGKNTRQTKSRAARGLCPTHPTLFKHRLVVMGTLRKVDQASNLLSHLGLSAPTICCFPGAKERLRGSTAISKPTCSSQKEVRKKGSASDFLQAAAATKENHTDNTKLAQTMKVWEKLTLNP